MPGALPTIEIVIPTYQRHVLLERALASCRAHTSLAIRVLDNGSEPPVMAAGADDHVIYHRHPANIGYSPNFLRALELAQSEWLWPVFDDVEVLGDSQIRLLDAVAEHPTAAAILWVESLEQPLVLRSSDDVLDFIQTPREFLATCRPYQAVFRRGAMLDALRGAYAWGGQLPHLALLLRAVDQAPIVLLPGRLVTPGSAESWDGAAFWRSAEECSRGLGPRAASRYRRAVFEVLPLPWLLGVATGAVPHPEHDVAEADVRRLLRSFQLADLSQRGMARLVAARALLALPSGPARWLVARLRHQRPADQDYPTTVGSF